ncbi:hypothetical protein CASFOL_022333 [Castilleja foliolosa]|uniref:Uncharacterized protein n=1 Tax=Castilleja foliolosa TaxID=1961234 RepID=A0ABD3CW78_9LAMI
MATIGDRPAVPIRATFFNMYKWPESEVKFLKSIISGQARVGRPGPDGYACRQSYLRSYTFSREKDNCFKKINKFLRRLEPKRSKKSSCGGGAYVDSLCRRMLCCTFNIGF